MSIEINSKKVQAKLENLANQLENSRPLFMAIAGALGSQTEANFEAQGRPAWAPPASATVRARQKRTKVSAGFVGPSVMKILQDSGMLASSISTDYGDDFALVGAGGKANPYAAIHQFGGTIEREPSTTKVRLRTDAKGNLLRRGEDGKVGKSGNLAVFAKQEGSDAHKRYRETEHAVGAYTIKIPARPYLPFKGSAGAATLQPETERTILDLVSDMIRDSLN